MGHGGSRGPGRCPLGLPLTCLAREVSEIHRVVVGLSVPLSLATAKSSSKAGSVS